MLRTVLAGQGRKGPAAPGNGESQHLTYNKFNIINKNYGKKTFSLVSLDSGIVGTAVCGK